LYFFVCKFSGRLTIIVSILYSCVNVDVDIKVGVGVAETVGVRLGGGAALSENSFYLLVQLGVADQTRVLFGQLLVHVLGYFLALEVPSVLDRVVEQFSGAFAVFHIVGPLAFELGPVHVFD